MSRRHLIMLLALAAIWGVVVPVHRDRAARARAGDADPVPDRLRRARAGALRRALAATASRALRAVRRARSRCSACVNTACPFFLIAWGQQYIDSGLAAILNASAPLFTAALRARDRPDASASPGSGSSGIMLGFAGIVALVGFEPAAASAPSRARSPSSRASVCYALGGLYAGRRFAGAAARARRLRRRSPGRRLFALPFGAAQASAFGWEALAVACSSSASARPRSPTSSTSA